METIKIYEPIPGKCPAASGNHVLVRAAAEKGLTGIVITRGLGKGAARTGWSLQCDQIPNLHLGYEIKEAEARINKISLI